MLLLLFRDLMKQLYIPSYINNLQLTFQSLYHDRQGVAVVPPTVPGAFLGIPEKGTMKKQKSIGMMYIQ